MTGQHNASIARIHCIGKPAGPQRKRLGTTRKRLRLSRPGSANSVFILFIFPVDVDKL